MSRKNQNHGRLESLHFRGCSVTEYGIQTVQVSTVSVRLKQLHFLYDKNNANLYPYFIVGSWKQRVRLKRALGVGCQYCLKLAVVWLSQMTRKFAGRLVFGKMKRLVARKKKQQQRKTQPKIENELHKQHPSHSMVFCCQCLIEV